MRCGRAAAAVGRIGVLTLGVSLWWVVGLRIQGAYGLPVLQLTETVRTVAATSTPPTCSAGSATGSSTAPTASAFSIDQARDYVDRPPRDGRAASRCRWSRSRAAAIVRWRHRTYFVLLVVVGTVIGVGAWPYDDPSPYGRAVEVVLRQLRRRVSRCATRRASCRSIVLGLAGLLAAACRRWRASARTRAGRARRRGRGGGARRSARSSRCGATATSPPASSAPRTFPTYWDAGRRRAAARGRHAPACSRSPGANFPSYRWGNTVEPVTPGLTDRPYLAREVLPVRLAADGEPARRARPPHAGRHLRTDVARGRRPPVRRPARSCCAPTSRTSASALPRPRALWEELTEPTCRAGLDTAGALRPRPRTERRRSCPLIDAPTLRDPGARPTRPPSRCSTCDDAVPIVHTAPTEQPVVLSGDGDGIVDAAAAGLIDGNQLVLAAGGAWTTPSWRPRSVAAPTSW